MNLRKYFVQIYEKYTYFSEISASFPSFFTNNGFHKNTAKSGAVQMHKTPQFFMLKLYLSVEKQLQLHGEGKSPALQVNVQNLDFDNLADLNNIQRMPNKLVANL